MIVKLWLAANVVDIPETGIPTFWAHLQVVAEDSSGNFFELQVQPTQVPPPTIPGVHWIVDGADGSRNHLSTTEYSSDTTGTYYKITEITNLDGRNPDDVWDILKQAAQQIETIQESIEYDLDEQNSNAFIKTILSMVGVDVENYLSLITPSHAIGGFPAVSRNINLFDSPVVNYQLEGTSGRDIIKTGIGNDFLFGGLNDDTDTPSLEGDGVSDRLYGDLGTDEYRMFDLRTIDYNDPLSIGAAIGACDYISDYDENGFVTILNPNGFVTRLANYTFRPGDGEPGVVWIGENPHAQPIRIMLLRAETETQEGIWGVVNDDNQVMFLLPDGALPPQPEQLLFGGPEVHLTGQNMPSSFLGFRFPELMNPIAGTWGADSLAGSTEDDYILADAGNDTAAADDGNDVVRGGDGNDSLTGGDGLTIFRARRGTISSPARTATTISSAVTAATRWAAEAGWISWWAALPTIRWTAAWTSRSGRSCVQSTEHSGGLDLIARPGRFTTRAIVMPAQAGIPLRCSYQSETPAFALVTNGGAGVTLS